MRGGSVRWFVACVAVVMLSASTVRSAQSELVIVRESQGAKEYHRPGCPLVRDGKGVLAMTRGEAESRGYKSHRDCDPAVAAAAAKAPATPPKPETVIIDAGGTHYHRKDCARIGKDPKAVALTAVGKRWPCPVCRPPVPKRTNEPIMPRWRGRSLPAPPIP